MKPIFHYALTVSRILQQSAVSLFPRRPAARKAAAISAFSLIGLMSVMAVVTVFAGLSVPALKGLTGANAVDASAGKLSGLLTLARSEAIARHTIVRFVVATDWSGQGQEANLRRVSLWAWHADAGRFLQLTNWEDLPVGVIIERQLPEYIRAAQYAADDASTVRGSSVLDEDSGTDTKFSSAAGTDQISGRFIEFLPSGSARLPGSAERRAIFVATQGFADANQRITYTAQTNGAPTNWAQVNVDTLTGRTHIYRP